MAALFLLLVSDTNDYLTAQVTLYLSAQVSIHSLSRNLAAVLLGAHTHAAWIGRRLAGVSDPLSQTDHQFAQSVMQTQAAYLTALLNDLSNARYPDTEDGLNGSLAARLRLWARRLLGTANEAWALALPPDTLVYWRLGAEPEHHCTVCPDRAENGPYPAHSLQWHPGDGQSPCLSNCYCFLETADGQRGFTL